MNLKQNFWFDLSNKVVVITGGSGLLGIQFAKTLLECGAKVVIADIKIEQSKELANYSKNQLQFKYLDITSDSSITLLKTEIEDTLGKANVLINNAALNPVVKKSLNKLGRLENYTSTELVEEISVNLIGAIACGRTFGEYFADNNDGIILNVASDLALISPDQRLYLSKHVDDAMQPVKPVTYSVAKAGLIGLTKYLATYWLNKNIRVNAICPGGVENGQDPEFIRKISERIPLGRLARIDEYNSIVAYLCSDESSYVNGAILSLDGGRTTW